MNPPQARIKFTEKRLLNRPAELFCAELFYMLDNNTRFKIVPMEFHDGGNKAEYACSLKVEGYGLQNINARVRPANKIVRDLHPELVKRAAVDN